MILVQHSTRYPRLYWQAFSLLFIVTATMGMGDCGNNNPAVSTAPSGGSPSGGSSGVSLSASLVQQAYLKASNTEAGDAFGTTVALDGDTLVVGTGAEDSNATGVNGNQADNSDVDSGAVYVFTRTGGVWTQQAYLKASNAEVGDTFGRGLALRGDTLVVGAFSDDSNATGVGGNQADNSASESGAVYVFRRTGGVWAQENYVKASNTEAGDRFRLVALDGDTLVVGATSEDSSATGVGGNQADNNASGSGAVYVFQ